MKRTLIGLTFLGLVVVVTAAIPQSSEQRTVRRGVPLVLYQQSVMALDDRVFCAAPSCYITTFRRLIETIGPQDAEQNIFGQIADG